ncbi:MAG: flotillin-like protein FloA [Kiritimatiellaceae bacterium]|nr:flotillin-like protein FloA [Kiritimatiellaceae bacterium]
MPFILGVFLLVVILVFVGIILSVLAAWVQAWGSGAPIKLHKLVGMKLLRKVPVMLITRARIQAMQAGVDLSTDLLEAHYLARGNVINVVQALIAADKACIELSFNQAAAIDLAGRDILDAVTTSVNPKVIDCPNPEKGTPFLDAVAKDGIRLLIKARVTVRTNLDQLVGGATEDTIIARVGQGIVSAVGSMASYKNVLENPDHISKKVLDSGLDAQTAFEIVSIDIADVSVAGTANTANVGAQLETERAEADKKMRQAEAEGRRAMAIAQEQEMRARVQEMQAKVIEAQAQVPLAISQAFKDGNLGVMDFYKMQNVMADTSMRESLAGGEEQQGE